MKKEIWLPVRGYVGLYEVSNFGNVRSLNYRGAGQTKLLSPVENKHGYLQVCLYNNGKGKIFKVHRLVIEAFIPNPLNLPQINHKDENKTNNFCGTLENDFNDGNLEWCDCKYNINYGTHNERVAEKNSKPVLQLTLDGELVCEWPSTREAWRNGYSQGTITLCCRGERKYHQGFIWKYK